MRKTLIFRRMIDYFREKSERNKKEKANGEKIIRRDWERGAGGKKRKSNQFGNCDGLHLELVKNKLF